MPKPVMLIIMDGLGIREMIEGNAVRLARTPRIDRWMTTLERSILDASGEAVGLTEGQMGNSEVGHLNLGAGRIVYQDITRIDIAIRNGSFSAHPILVDTLRQVKTEERQVHLIGLVSDGGVHSHINHLYALLAVCKMMELDPLVHVITDGRDTPPQSGVDYVRALQAKIAELDTGRVVSVSGRYYAMDRDKRWERTALAYKAIALGQADERFTSAVEALEASYRAGVTDEFVKPAVIGDGAVVRPGDSLIFYNFRADRMRQIVEAFAYAREDGFMLIPGLHMVTFTVYEDDYPVKVLFGKENLDDVLAEVISRAGLRQYHSAETEKYPHVTFFFNGRREHPFPGEDRVIIPSPKVATYDLKPQMSAYELTEATLERLRSRDDDFILVNFANPDMVGHTGVLEAAIKAVETTDECAGRLVDAVLAKGGVAIVTADHGNCERMIELATGEPHTYHTTNPVSLWVISSQGYYRLRPRGILADVAPTVLDLMGLDKPAAMTGQTLIEAHKS
ncbi:MAG: 2,3-bisphosphoglycerate-independent phosphoglycerate mutase [Anaerolineae bacterium]|nr:2,3-bisphosphoglycerate-independent phosphoglycerate mutase [Anaerolineae bacterium]MDW8171541.1 2,3-bisphosphoglycerate-independent phosphoglycerate mutase [Anaerolineae bacterium]